MPSAIYRVASDAAAFAEAMLGGEFEAVVLDNEMGWSRGAQLAPVIRRRFPTAGIVMLAGEGDEESAAEATRAGCDAYMARTPANYFRVTQAVEKAIAARRVKVDERSAEERELRERLQALELQNAGLTQFASIASHELQEPLRTVERYTRLLESEYGAGSGDASREFMNFIRRGTAKMQSLVDDLLSYTRLETRAQPPGRMEVDTAIEEAVSELAALVEENEASVMRDTLPPVMADRWQVVALFRNLIANAIKFRREDPPRVRISGHRDGDFVEFVVEDNGIGFESRDAKRIFEVFQRLHTEEEYPGTGIGLAVCRRVVERHGGRIWAESRPGRGSTFRFTLPAASPIAAAASIHTSERTS